MPPSGINPTGPVEGCDVYHVTYWNADANGGAGAYEVLQGATYNLNITDDQTGQIINNQGGSIGQDGEVVICTWQGVGYNGSITLTSLDGNSVTPTDAAYFGGGDTQQYSGYYELVATGNASRVFMNLIPTTSGSQSLLGYARPPIFVNVGGSSTYYSQSEDRIHIGTSDIWGEWGIFAVAHEYGHAAHQRALGGIQGFGDCPGSGHYIDGSYNLGCAWTEGFADFHGAYTRRDALTMGTGSDYSIERNLYYSSGDGSIIEGAVAAFLYDLVDGPNDPDGSANQSDGVDDDSVQYSGNYLANLMRTCNVVFYSPNRGENGIDDLVYCLERQVDPAVRNSSVYFPTRPEFWKATSESEGAAEPPTWSQTAIRALWTHNLYGQ
jgi:hypothetical protein